MELETPAIATTAAQMSLDTVCVVLQDSSFTKAYATRTAHQQPLRTKLNLFGNVPLARTQVAQSAQAQEIISVYVASTRAPSTSCNLISRNALLTVFATVIPTPLLTSSATPVSPTAPTSQRNSFVAVAYQTTSSILKTPAQNVPKTAIVVQMSANATYAKPAIISTRVLPAVPAPLKASSRMSSSKPALIALTTATSAALQIAVPSALIITISLENPIQFPAYLAYPLLVS